MRLIERILCPVDPGSPADSALRYSYALAERFHAAIDVVPLAAMLSHTRRTRSDLVVVGSGRLRSDVAAVPPGIGEAVAHHADCAVLSLCEAEELDTPFSIGRILLAVDFSEATDLAIDWTAALVSRFGARLQLLHVRNTAVTRAPRLGLAGLVDDERVVAERLNDIECRLARRGVEVELAALSDGLVPDCLVEHSRIASCDLIVLGAHDRTGDGAIHGVVAEVRRRSRVPVLSVRKSRPEVMFAAPGYGDLSQGFHERAGGRAEFSFLPARTTRTRGASLGS